jgi:hypothetical protein
MKINKTIISLILAGALSLTTQGLTVSAEEEPKMGRATYFGTEADEATLNDDTALKEMGFDDTDIEYLKSGKDVTYTVKYDKSAPCTYEELDKDGKYKKMIDAYFGTDGIEPDDSIMTTFFTSRVRGDEDPEKIKDVTGVTGRVTLGLLEEQGDVYDFVANGTIVMLYLEGEKAVNVAKAVSVSEEQYVSVDFEFIGSGNYIVIYDVKEEESSSEPESSEAESSAAESISPESPRLESSEASSVVSSNSTDNPKTGTGYLFAAVIILAGAAAVTAKKSK